MLEKETASRANQSKEEKQNNTLLALDVVHRWFDMVPIVERNVVMPIGDGLRKHHVTDRKALRKFTII